MFDEIRMFFITKSFQWESVSDNSEFAKLEFSRWSNKGMEEDNMDNQGQAFENEDDKKFNVGLISEWHQMGYVEYSESQYCD